MAPTIFRSSDASAPALNGNAGSLVNVLDGCLVSGYGSLTALGWAKSFSATNKAVYRAPAGVRHYLDVDDSGPDATALGRNARCRGYETMSAVATGTGPFPTTAQVTTCVGVVKSTTADATSRPWILIGDDRTFYFFCTVAGTTPPNLATNVWNSGFHFGEIYSFLAGDLYRTMLGFASITSTQAASTGIAGLLGPQFMSTTTAVNANMPRSYTGTGGSVWVASVYNFFMTNAAGTTEGSKGVMAYPNPVDSGLYANAINVAERGNGASAAASTNFRGRLRGIYQQAHLTSAFADQDTFTGTGDFAGKTFILINHVATTNSTLAIETTSWAASS